MIDKKLLKFCGHSKRYIILAVMSNSVRLLLGIAFAYLFAYALSHFVTSQRYLYLLPILLIVLVGKQMMIRVTGNLNFKIVREVKQKLRDVVFRKALDFGISFQDQASTQELIHLAVEGVEQLETYYGGYLTQFYYCFVSSLFLFGAVYPLYPPAAWVLLIASPLIPLSLMGMLTVVRSTQRKYWQKYTDVGNLFLDSLRGLTTLKIFSAEKRRALEMDERSENFRKQTMRLLAMQLNSMLLIDWIAYGTTAAVIILAIVNFANAHLSLFAVLALILLAAEFFVPMKALTSLFHVAMTGASAGEQILEFLDVKIPEKHGQTPFSEQADVKLNDFSYTYPDGTKAVRHVNLWLESGKFTALIGASGCGKSTVAALISGERQTQSPIFYGGISHEQLEAGALAKKVVRISHESHLFAGTVRENLNFANKKIDDQRMIDLLKKLQLWSFLEEKQGLDTLLLSAATNVSGGQRQRLALARGILGDFQIYIFDEASASVDVESEKIILEMIQDLAKTKTVLYISHKMRSLVAADYCYVMADGQVIQSGKPQELVAKPGLYRDLYQEQEQLLAYSQVADLERGEKYGQ